jgi:hypothetical protein
MYVFCELIHAVSYQRLGTALEDCLRRDFTINSMFYNLSASTTTSAAATAASASASTPAAAAPPIALSIPTTNAAGAASAVAGKVEDWSGTGLSDLRGRLIRTPLPPLTTFKDVCLFFSRFFFPPNISHLYFFFDM